MMVGFDFISLFFSIQILTLKCFMYLLNVWVFLYIYVCVCTVNKRYQPIVRNACCGVCVCVCACVVISAADHVFQASDEAKQLWQRTVSSQALGPKTKRK